MLAADRASWQNPRILTTLVLVFLTGAMAGAITMRAGLHDQAASQRRPYWRRRQERVSPTTGSKEN